MECVQNNPYVSGYLFSCIVGGVVVFLVWLILWKIAKPEGDQKKLINPKGLAIFHGIVERALYTSCIVLGRPEGIAVWLAFKALQRVRIGEQTDYIHVKGTTIYVTCSALSVAFGVIGGMIATGKWTLAHSLP